MLSCLTRLFNRIRYGKLITEDYTGKVVRVSWYIISYEEGVGHRVYKWSIITVLWDDGKYNIAGPILAERDRWTTTPLDSKTGLVHARKGSVTVVANSEAEWREEKRVKQTKKKWQQGVCSNGVGDIGIVTDYDGTTFHGKSIADGTPWKSKSPKLLAETYGNYSA